MNRRKITKNFLMTYGFKNDLNKNIWEKRTTSSQSYTYYRYKYYWRERKLEVFGTDCVGFITTKFEILDEFDIINEIRESNI